MARTISELIEERETHKAVGELADSNQTEEGECPDCQDAMTLFYDENDAPQHACENCGYLVLPRSCCTQGDYHRAY